MFEFWSHLSRIYVSSGPSEPCSSRNSSDLLGTPAALDLSNKKGENISTVKDFHQHVRRLSGLKNDVFCNLRVPNQFQTSREEINLIIITGAGVYCIDVKWWTGAVLAQDPQTWHIRMKMEEQNFTSTSIQQVPDPLQDITRKARGLCSHMQQCGVNIRQSLFLPRVIFLSPYCNLDDELKKRKELIAYGDVETFLCSLRDSYLTWITDAFTSSWISGHLSFRQLFAIRGVLSRMGTWDVILLSSGQELKGDFQDCHHLAFNRQETDVLEFSRRWSLLTDTLWSLLGHTPQVNVKMYKRGAESWLGKPLTGTASIPSNTIIVFRISGEDKVSKIPANTIQTITLSI